MTYLTFEEFMEIETLPSLIESDAATPEIVRKAIEILQRVRAEIIAKNMREAIDEETHEENYD